VEEAVRIRVSNQLWERGGKGRKTLLKEKGEAHGESLFAEEKKRGVCLILGPRGRGERSSRFRHPSGIEKPSGHGILPTD